VGKRRPSHSHPEGSQSGIREAAITARNPLRTSYLKTTK
jgi:hypothetical protein